jgi:hypothetical protein
MDRGVHRLRSNRKRHKELANAHVDVHVYVRRLI